MGRSKEFDENVVLQKAMKLFWEQGYEKTSMNDLVEHMGIHRRSLYDTFGDKHTLFLRAIDYYQELIKREIQIKIAHTKTSKQAIQLIFESVIEGYSDFPRGCLMVNSATEMALYDKEVEERVEKAFMEAEEMLIDIVRKGQETGEFSCDYKPEILGEILQNSLLGIRVLLRTTESKEKMYRITNFFLNLLVK